MGFLKRLCRFILTLLVLLVFVNSATAQFGRISGRVNETDTDAALPGANVFVKGTAIGSSTNHEGRYLITRVPAGSYTLEVRYLGYETKSVDVQVSSGEETAVDFSLAETVLAGEEVVVLGMRAKNQARALNQQMNAATIKNIVASDQFGRFPDNSAPDALQRVPAVHIVRDLGEGRYVQIRGASPAMTNVQFNGERIPSPEGDVRQIALDAVPIQLLETIEVTKALTPDMDADAIGGSVNLVTKTAPETGLLTLEGGPGYSSIRTDWDGKVGATWGRRFNDSKLGLLVAGTFARRDFGADDLEPVWDLSDEGRNNDLIDDIEVRHYTLRRERAGINAVLDYRVSENTEFDLKGVWTQLLDDEQRRRLRHRVGQGEYNGDGTVSNGELVFQHKDRQEKLRSWNITGRGRHLLGGNMKLDYSATVTRSKEDTPWDREIEFGQGDVLFRPDISNPDQPQSGASMEAIDGAYAFDNIQPASSFTENTDYVAALNFELPYGLGSQSIGSVKLGGKFRSKDKNQDVSENEFQLIDGAEDIILGQDIGSPFSNDGYNPGVYPYPSRVTTKEDVEGFTNRYGSVLDQSPVIEADAEDFKAEEQTYAGYAMTEINFTPKVMLLGGVRLEHTRLENTGYAWDSETETLTEQKGANDYTKVLPMLHLRYKLSPTTNLRLAGTTALQRPNFFDLAPYRIRDGEDLALGNPDLKPAYSYNLDLMLEHYIQPLGVVSLGGFYKSIQDPIYGFTFGNELGGDSDQPGNGQDARIVGFEVAYQQQFKFLPSPLNGLGLYTNYTYAHSKTTLPDGREARFAGQADHIVNAALSYERGFFSGQFSVNYTGDFIDEFGGDIGGGAQQAFSDVFVDSHLQFDLTANFRLTQQFSLYVEWINISNERWRLYQADKVRPIQREFYETWFWVGFNFSK